MNKFWDDLVLEIEHSPDKEKAYIKASRKIKRRNRQIQRKDWIVNNIPILGFLMSRYWIWRNFK